jgi:CheY-like chemotaxis protein
MKAFVAARTKRLLVVEDNDIERQSIVELLESDDIEITTAGTGWKHTLCSWIAPSIVACSISDFPI